MLFEIDGVDFSDCVLEGGIQWTRNDIDSAKSGRTSMDGLMHRARVAIKYKATVNCRPLKQERARQLLNALLPVYIKVQTDHPLLGVTTFTMYANNIPTNHYTTYQDGETVWSGINFPIVER